jgi:hypothetical protein
MAPVTLNKSFDSSMQGQSQTRVNGEYSDHGRREAELLAGVCDANRTQTWSVMWLLLEQLKSTSVAHQSHLERQSIT